MSQQSYVYGAVSQDATPILACSMILVLGFAAFLPGFLSAGESALVQQRGYEDEQSKITINEFTQRRQKEKRASGFPKKK
jgi:hypothetical protein